MNKHLIKINIEDFPKELYFALENAALYDSSCGSEAKVLYSDLGYYIKIAEKNKLKKEAELISLFERKGIGAKLVSYLSKDKDYMVTKEVKGQDATHLLENPRKLCEVLAEAIRYLHSQSIVDVPTSVAMEQYVTSEKGEQFKRDTLIHGDFCLPNIIFDNWKLSGFIDVGLSGVGDKHIDLYWAIWSLHYNLKTDVYREYFLDLYGRENFDQKTLELVEEVEKSFLNN